MADQLEVDAQQLRQRNRELLILNAIADALNCEVDIDRALETALAQAADLMQLQTAWIWLLDEDTGKSYLACSQNIPSALLDNPRRMEGNCYCLDTYREGDLDGTANVNVVTCSRLKNLVDGTDGLRYHASIPLYAHEKKLGVLNVASADWRELSEDDLRILHTFGDMLSIAVERARLYAHSARLGAVNERVRNAVHRALDLARSNLEEARRSVLDLRAAPLEGRSLSIALHDLVREANQEDMIKIEFEASGANRPIAARLEVGIYPIAQEAITNIVKHSNASVAPVSLVVSPSRATLKVMDNGEGFDSQRVPKNRYGLIGMTERVHMHGGKLRLESTPGEGTLVEAQLPL